MSAPAPESILWDALRGALQTRALAIVADLQVADVLRAGPQPVEDVARRLGANPDTLQRLLRALASDGIFAEETPGVFGNTDASALLRNTGWDDFAHLFGGIWLRAIGELDASGDPTFPEVFGADFWDWLASNPDERAAFDRAMEQGSDSRIERLASVEWRGDETVVDVGGGNGSLLRSLLELKPGLRGIVFDLPETMRDESAFGDRLTFVAGSFFESVPPGSVYLLSTILHNWNDDSATAILRTIRASAVAGSRLILLESVIEPGNERDGAKWLDLLMLTLFAARERNEAQWRALLEGEGFRIEWMQDGLIEARRR